MAYTLYINPVTNKAFIRILWLADTVNNSIPFPAIARCIDLYVAGLHGIWVINTDTLQVQGQYLKQQDFTGLAMSGDGHTLYGVDPATGITLLDSSSGETRTVIKGVVQAPWGIEWATG